MVRPDRADSRRADDQADAGPGQEAQDGHGRADVRGGHAGRVLQHGRRDRRRRASTWASSARFISRTATRASGRSFISGRATWATPCSTRRSARWASTSATTATSPMAPAAWASMAPRSCSTRRRRSPGLSEYLWKLEQPAHAVANHYFVGAINRPGWEEPWRIGEFYGQSYFGDPRGQFIAKSEKRDGGRHRRRRHRLRHDPRGPQRLAILPRPPAGDVRGDYGAMTICN